MSYIGSEGRARRKRRTGDVFEGERELDYHMVKRLWAFSGDRLAVKFDYDWHDQADNWVRVRVHTGFGIR